MAALPATILSTVQKLVGVKINVVSPETELAAREYLASIRKELKAFKASVLEIKRPFKQEIDDIDKASKPWLAKLQEKDDETERAILTYLRKVREETEKANQKALEKYEKKVAMVEAKAIANDKPVPIVIPPMLASAPPKTVELEGAKQTIVKRKAWRMKRRDINAEMSLQELFSMCGRTDTDDWWPSDIPGPEHFFLDTAQIGKIVRAGGTVPGVEVYEEESLSQRAV